MITDEHRRSRGLEVVVRILDFECYAGRKPHGKLESSRSGPLRDAVLAQRTEEDGNGSSVECADNEADIGCHQTGDEASEGHFVREDVETEVEHDVSQQTQKRIVEYGIHGRV